MDCGWSLVAYHLSLILHPLFLVTHHPSPIVVLDTLYGLSVDWNLVSPFLNIGTILFPPCVSPK